MYVCVCGRVVSSVVCIISNKAEMDCGVQPFWVRWTESKYCTACSNTPYLPFCFYSPLSPSLSDSLFFSLPISLCHYFSLPSLAHCPWGRGNLLKWLSTSHYVFSVPLSSLHYRSRTKTHPQSHTHTDTQTHTHTHTHTHKQAGCFVGCKSSSNREAVTSHIW